MTSPSSGECIRGHDQRGVHWAACADAQCTGCAPAKVREGLVVCDDCRRRVRGLIRLAPELLERLHHLALPNKATVFTPVKRTSKGVLPDASEKVDALLEAADAIDQTLAIWRQHFDVRTCEGMDDVLADWYLAKQLLGDVLELHDHSGENATRWSIADAVARWGMERRDSRRYRYPEDDLVDPIVTPVREWHDPLLALKDAALRAEVSQRQIRNWIKAEVIAPRAKLRSPGGAVTQYFAASDVDRAAQLMKQRRHAGVALPLE